MRAVKMTIYVMLTAMMVVFGNFGNNQALGPPVKKTSCKKVSYFEKTPVINC